MICLLRVWFSVISFFIAELQNFSKFQVFRYFSISIIFEVIFGASVQHQNTTDKSIGYPLVKLGNSSLMKQLLEVNVDIIKYVTLKIMHFCIKSHKLKQAAVMRWKFHNFWDIHENKKTQLQCLIGTFRKNLVNFVKIKSWKFSWRPPYYEMLILSTNECM